MSTVYHCAVVFTDHSTNFTPTSRKHCTPSQRCTRWFCLCGRTARAPKLRTSLLGILVCNQTSAESISPEAVFVPVFETDHATAVPTIPLENRWRAICTLLTQKKICCFNAQALYVPIIHRLCVLEHRPLPLSKNMMDTKVGGWLLNSSASGSPEVFEFSALYEKHCQGQSRPHFAASSSAQADSGTQAVVHRLFDDVKANYILGQKLMEDLSRNGMLLSAKQIEMPTALVLSAMEVWGIALNPSSIENSVKALDSELSSLEDAAQAAAGKGPFNIASAEQVSHVLYNSLSLPKPKAAAGKKHPSVSREVLEGIKNRHDLVPLILRHRTLAKLRSTYTSSLTSLAVPDLDHAAPPRIHANFNQTAVETGRISCW